MSVTHVTAVRNASLAAVIAQLDAAGAAANAKIVIYTGSEPGVNNVATGTLLATLNLNSPPSFPAPSAGASTMNGLPVSASIVATGTAGYGRLLDRGGVAVQEFAIATSGSDLNFSGGINLISGGTCSISTWTATAMP
jgi:hypothetical protein